MGKRKKYYQDQGSADEPVLDGVEDDEPVDIAEASEDDLEDVDVAAEPIPEPEPKAAPAPQMAVNSKRKGRGVNVERELLPGEVPPA